MKFTAILILGAATALKLNNESTALIEDNKFENQFNDALDNLEESNTDIIEDLQEYLDEHQEDIDQAQESLNEVFEQVDDKVHQVADKLDERVHDLIEGDDDELAQIFDLKTKVAVQGVKYLAKQFTPSDDQEEVELAQEDLDQQIISALEEQGITEEDIDESIQNFRDEYEQDIRDSVIEAKERVEDFLDNLSDDEEEVQLAQNDFDEQVAEIFVEHGFSEDDVEKGQQRAKQYLGEQIYDNSGEELSLISNPKTQGAKIALQYNVSSLAKVDDDEEDQESSDLAQVNGIKIQAAKQGVKHQVNSSSNDEDESLEDLEQELAQTKSILEQLQENVQTALEQIAHSQYSLYLH